MMASDYIVNVSDSNFDTLVLEYSYTAPVVVDFWADWCGPCKMLGPILEKIANEAEGLFRLAKVDVDSNQNLAVRFGIHSIPAVKAFRNGKVIAEFSGAQPEPKVREFLKSIAPTKHDLLIEKANNLINALDWLGASVTFQEILKTDPNNPSALLGKAKCALATNEPDTANEILKDFPASKEFQTAQLLQPLAQALHKQFVQTENETLDAAFNNSLRLITRGNFPAAMDGLLDILRENKEYMNGLPKDILIAIFELLGNETAAVKQYRREFASVIF